MTTLNLKPAGAAVKRYYAALETLKGDKFENEGNVRGAFADLLKHCARQFEWTLVEEYRIERKDARPISVDGMVKDAFLPRGYWEAKDDNDSLDAEMKKKFAAGYPQTNILFQRPTEALLYQDGRKAFQGSIETPEKLVEVLRLFFEWRQPEHDSWDRAVSGFSERIPEIAQGAMDLIESEKKSNKAFVAAFGAFAELCRESINPDLKDEAVEEMLVQHLLTERVFRRIFNNPEFTRRNVIAAEIEKVIDSLTKKHFSRDSFLKDLDPFYKAIEEAAATTESYTEKQAFLNTIYERFFQGFNKKQADTHGIVYTPQPIVDFMVRSVEEILKSEFGRSLSDRDVHILDPFVGTGNFILRTMKEIKKTRIQQKYKEELHCNEIMLLPYYIASMNIEHQYMEMVGEYEPFEGICLVDTFELAEPRQAGFEFMTAGNTERIRRLKKAPIFVVIGNPPYNMGQDNENDQNKNRKYKHMDARVQETYTKASTATLRNKLSDPYVKAFRWASDRIRAGGVVAFVSNDSFVDQIAFDGMRKYLAHEFDRIYVLDLGGNVRKNPKLSGTTHNVFGIQVGVAITLLIKKSDHDISQPGEIFYASVGEDWKKEQKYGQLNDWEDISGTPWIKLDPDAKNTWLTKGQQDDFQGLIPLGVKGSKSETNVEAVFRSFSLGIVSARDAYVFNFEKLNLERAMCGSIDSYRETLEKYRSIKPPRPKPDAIVNVDDGRTKWSRQTKRLLGDLAETHFNAQWVRDSLYRPFTKCFHYFDDFWNEERYQLPRILPKAESENSIICATAPGYRSPWSSLATNILPTYTVCSTTDSFQCFPLYTYDEDGTNRRENITDWALGEFRSHYGRIVERLPSGAKAPAVLKAVDGTAEAVPFQNGQEQKQEQKQEQMQEQPQVLRLRHAARDSAQDDKVSGVEEGFREIEKLDIFHYVYGLLHHPEYRRRYAANLKRELPRIPYAEDFGAVAGIGRELMGLHVGYESQAEYPLERRETGQLDWRVDKMSLSKDKTQLKYNEFLTLSGIPAQVYEYRLGNRSALEWVVDQYRVTVDKRSGIRNDPNREDDPEYIVRLIGQVVGVSVETVRLVRELERQGIGTRD